MSTCRDGLNCVSKNKSKGPFYDNKLWTVDRFSKYLDVPTATIRDWCYKRLIPFVKIGRHIRFMPSDVEKWLFRKE